MNRAGLAALVASVCAVAIMLTMIALGKAHVLSAVMTAVIGGVLLFVLGVGGGLLSGVMARRRKGDGAGLGGTDTP